MINEKEQLTRDFLRAELQQMKADILEQLIVSQRWNVGLILGLYATNMGMFIGIYALLK